MRKPLVLAAVAALIVPLLAPPAGAVVGIVFSDGTLAVTGDDTAEDVTVACVSGSVDVGGGDTGVACGDVGWLEIRLGGGDDAVELGGVSATDFPALGSIRAWGEEGDDTLLGSPLDDRLNGGPGADELRGLDGEDRLTPEDGGGVAVGGDGKDRVLMSGAGPWTFGRDAIVRLSPTREETGLRGVETIVYRGTAGADTVSGVNFRGSVVANGGAGDDLIHTGPDVDRLVGGPGHDQLDGGPGDDVLLGKAGEDFLSGGDGNDLLVGGPGSDFCLSGPGTDVNRSC